LPEPIPLQCARAEVWRTKRQEALARMTLEVDALYDLSHKRIQDSARCWLPHEAEAAVVEALKPMAKAYHEAKAVLRTLHDQFSETRPPLL
jgi:hypothetical protein